MARYCCFRFDVDTHRCIRRGVPNLLELGARIDASFTFFVNMGRAVSRKRAVKKLFAGPDPGPDVAEKLSPRGKLGLWDTVVATLLNPRVGAGSPQVLRNALAAGHEIGLHGGTNHAVWQADAHSWSAGRVRYEVTRALDRLTGVTGERPRGFASPGWNTSAHLPRILPELGFEYLADAHGPGDSPAVREGEGGALTTVRTEICGEPGGVAYIENLRARSLDSAAVRDDFRRRLGTAGPLAIAYDHPYYAGIRELHLIPELVAIARDLGFRVVRIDQALDALRAQGP